MTAGWLIKDVRAVLAVVAHPDDESFGLGAVLDRLTTAGADAAVLCFTHGEASTLHGVPGDLAEIRSRELAEASSVLGIARTELLAYPDAYLDRTPAVELAAHVRRLAVELGTSHLLAFDTGGITGHPDHMRATEAALVAAEELDLPVLGWTLPQRVAAVLSGEFGTNFEGRTDAELDAIVSVDRTRQRQAIACHRSQAMHNPVLYRRLDLMGDLEHLRWLRRPLEGRSAA